MPTPARASWLAGTSVAVTHADGALGRAVAASLGSRRLRLALVGTNPAMLNGTAEEVARVRALHQIEDPPLVVEADATTPEGVATLEASTSATIGPLDALVHVVEIGDPSLLAATTAAVLAVAGRSLLQRGGALVLAAVAGPWHATERSAAHAATAHAMDALVRDAAQRLHRRVVVNGVFLEASAPARSLGFEALRSAPPSTSDYDEAARVVRFLASREAQTLTGHTLTVGARLAEAA